MLTTNQILEHLPVFIAEDPYLRQLLLAKAEEYMTLDEVTADIERQLTVDTATWGLKLWEDSLGLISPDDLGSITKIEEDNEILKYRGNWKTENIAGIHPSLEPIEGSSNLLVKYCNASDKSNWFEFTFYGTGFKIIRSSINREEAQAEIYCDGTVETMQNKSISNPIYNFVAYEKTDLRWGLHTVRVSPHTAFNPGDDIGSIRDRFVFDRIEITNSLAESLEKRRKLIKNKLKPVISVTKKTVQELVEAYGFTNVQMDESEPNVFALKFDYNANTDLSIRKKMLTEISNLIPAHIEFDNMFLVSTFRDLLEHNITFDAMSAKYIFHDFLVKNILDKVDKFFYLNKYFDLSVFSYEHFNTDLEDIDYMCNLHSSKEHHNHNPIYQGNVTLATPLPVVEKLNMFDANLISEATRRSLYKLFNNKFYEGYKKTKITDVINEYKATHDKLELNVTRHPLLKLSGAPDSNSVRDLLEHTRNFINIVIPSVASINPDQVVKGYAAYTNEGLVHGTIKEFKPLEYLEKHAEIGYLVEFHNHAVTEIVEIPAQTDLLPENIVEGHEILGVVGTFKIMTPNDFNEGDYLDPFGVTEEDDIYYKLTEHARITLTQ